jgi:hypothetical protein
LVKAHQFELERIVRLVMRHADLASIEGLLRPRRPVDAWLAFFARG